MTRPRISVLLLAYQQAGTAAAAARSVLAQEGEAVEVILSDDASSDSTFAAFEAVAAAYRGPHHIVLRRNPHNLGIGAHYNALVEAARGELLVTAAGDDLSLSGRLARIAAAWDASGQRLDLIASPLMAMTPDGALGDRIDVDRLQDWHGIDDWARRRPKVIGAAHAFTRRLFDRFGPFGPGIAYEDQILTFRALAGGGALTLDDPLVAYRLGGTSERAKAMDAAGYLAWMRRQNDRHRAEAAQLLADARTAGIEARVREALGTDLQRQAFLARSLDAAEPHAAGSAWHALFSEPALPLGWRLRKWLGHRAPGLAAALRRRQEEHSG